MSTAVYEVITDRILSALDSGVVPWQKPWRAASDLPRNLKGRAYRGINVWLLLWAAQAKGYSDPRWLTYKQAVELGGKVRKGEKGMPVVLWKPTKVEATDPDTGETKVKTVPFIRYYTVFNVEQCEDIKVKPIEAGPVLDISPIEACDAIELAFADRPIVHENGGDRAYYDILADTIRLPKRATFRSNEAYYATKFHEFGHSTGAKHRLDRQGVAGFDHFGSGKYAKEELVAEMTAAYLCGEAGISPAVIDNTVAYIQNWRQVIKDDPKVVVHAAAAAQRAADYILGRAQAKVEEQPEQAAA